MVTIITKLVLIITNSVGVIHEAVRVPRLRNAHQEIAPKNYLLRKLINFSSG